MPAAPESCKGSSVDEAANSSYRHFDTCVYDTKRYVEATPNLDEAARRRVYEGNVRRVYPRLDAALRAGAAS